MSEERKSRAAMRALLRMRRQNIERTSGVTMSIADAAHYLGCEQSHVIELIEKKNMLDAINLATPQDPIYRVDRNSLKKLKEGQVKK